MAALIEARGLSKQFGSRVILDDLHLTVERGERVALLGLNGTGKTTLLRCAMGALSFEGSVRIGGVDVLTQGKRARELIGYVPQRPPLFAMNLGTTVDFFAALRGVAAQAIAQRLDALGLPLADTAELEMRALSGGMLQKALLAIALASDPPLLLLDEPTANLDPRARGDFMRALGEVSEDTTILLASHRLEEVETVADRVWILHEGRRVFDGTLDQLRDRAGADSWLWVRTKPERRNEVREEFVRCAGPEAVIANGTRVGVRLPAHARAEALWNLKQAGVPADDFWVTRPSLAEIVHGFFNGDAG